MRLSRRVQVLLLLATIGLAVGYYWVDPSHCRWVPRCAFHALTGLQCPACGSQRAIHSLLHGEWTAAFAYNPFLVISLPYFGAVVYSSFCDSRLARGVRRYAQHPWTVRIFLVLIVLWWVARNLIG